MMLWSAGFVTVYLSVMIYGFIWLEKETNIRQLLIQQRLEINKDINQLRLKSRLEQEDIYNKISNLESRIMPSAFKGRK